MYRVNTLYLIINRIRRPKKTKSEGPKPIFQWNGMVLSSVRTIPWTLGSPPFIYYFILWGVFVRLCVDLQLMDFKDCARRSTANVESNVV